VSTNVDASAPFGTYTPRYARPKAFMVLFGLALCAMGLWQLETPLRLLAFGGRARAETIDVIKTKVGLPDLVLHSDSQVQAGLESRDRSYLFWNEFRFHTANGQVVTVRAPVGSQLKPLYTLLDDDGLPTTDVVYYDLAHPEVVMFPQIISTWFAPGVVVLMGALAAFIGSVLFYWADKPIPLPHLPVTPSREEKSEP
jgi:hypothetical protein